MNNGYISVHVGENLFSAEFQDYEYEHVIVAEEMLGRPLKEGEVVHHLDFNRTNNSPDNLLVLSGPMHMKLHTWLDKVEIIPKPEYQERINRGCVRCKVCEKPIYPDMTYCSRECYNLDNSTVIKTNNRPKPSKEELEKLTKELPMTKIGEMFGVSNNAVKKWCKNHGIELGDRRGYWERKRHGLVD